jgi:tetratricopeptide (TPR) repeat protein
VDPITVATRSFLRDLERHWKRSPGRVARLIARDGDRTHVIKALRLAEHEPANRRPLFLHDGPFETPETYFATLCDRVVEDYALVRKGAEEEGVSLAPLEPPARSPIVAPEAHAITVLGAAADRLAARLDGALVALVPKAILEPEQWRKAVERLSRLTRSPSLRIAVHDSEDGPLAAALGQDGARFAFDVDELFDFAEQQVKRRSQGPATAATPALPAEQRDAFERTTGRKVPKPETSAALQALLLKGARAAAKNDAPAAVDAYRRARDLCRDEGLTTEEAAAQLALGGAYLSAGSRPNAQASYGQAALVAAQVQMWNVACQAKLGEAGVGWMEKDYKRAARAYAEAAALAARGDIGPLRIEALRMEGLCHLQQGAEPAAIEAWRRAIEAGTEAEEPARRASTFPAVVEALAGLLDRRGMRPQAAHLRTLLL